MAGICRFALAIFTLFAFSPKFSRATSEFQSLDRDTYDLIAKLLSFRNFSRDTLPKSLSNQCMDRLVNLTGNPKEFIWYLDASGKPPSGLLAGNMVGFLGSYSECIKMIDGAHYCLNRIYLPAKLSASLSKIEPGAYGFTWGICAPQQCGEQDVAEFVKEAFNRTLGSEADIKSIHCNKRSQYTTGVTITLTLCGVILFHCLVGTIIDIFLSFTTSHSLPIKSVGRLPVRDASMTTDQDAKPHVSNDNQGSFHRSQHASETTSLISPSPPSGHMQPVKMNAVIRFFLCFSLIQNTSRIMETQVQTGAITSIYGVRVLSMCWIILSNTHAYYIKTCMDYGRVPTIMGRFTFQPVLATVSADSFFLLSGLLVTYMSLRRMEKENGQLPLFKYYFHRFWRLTPTYMFVLLFWDKLVGFFAESPFWYELQSHEACDNYWWTNLLYINNFYPTTYVDMCMAWTWYLANDMQFYIIAPIILFPAYRFRLRGLLAVVGLLMSASFVSTAVLYAHYDLSEPLFGPVVDGADFGSLVYEKPYCRIAPYLTGMTLGYLFLNTEDCRSSKVRTYLFNAAGWCVSIFLALSTVYGCYKTVRKGNLEPFTRAESILYGTFARWAWSLAVAWVIFACHRGLGGLVDKILSARFWMPLSRLTYCAYLLHPAFLKMLVESFETVNLYSDFRMAVVFAGVLTISYAAAFIVSVCVELPTMQIENLIFKREG